MEDPKLIVKAGYDRVSKAYRDDNPDKASDAYQKYKSWVDELSSRLNPQSDLLDLGCGCGVPVTRILSEQHIVTGVDLSPVQIGRAEHLVPKAKFICADMCDMEFLPNSFDAVLCLYAIIHIPIAEQPALLQQIWHWLKPGGYLLVSVGKSEWTGQEKNWLDVTGGDMYWSHADRDSYVHWFSEIGFSIEWERFIPEGKEGHPLFLMKKLEYS